MKKKITRTITKAMISSPATDMAVVLPASPKNIPVLKVMSSVSLLDGNPSGLAVTTVVLFNMVTIICCLITVLLLCIDCHTVVVL